jgi:DNA-binding NtrC family response regulator
LSERVLVSTHDLKRAGALREAFRENRFAVELVTPDEDVSGVADAVLLVLTDGAEAAATDGLLAAARRHGELPVVGFVSSGSGAPSGGLPERGVSEAFAPGTATDEVVLVSRRLVERRRLQRVTGIVGETDAMREVLERVVQIAPVDSTVLVTGESGTGKELVARGLHALSPRRHKPFLAVNVAALTDTLLESELFGHEKGAFTGAIDSRRGLFELADGGTIFLDEIGEMPLATQTKLLRVLEQREFLRVGGERPIRVDLRVVTATNQDLRQLVAIREFRKDLYYRLNVLRIELPPLRERREDVPLLAERFIDEVTKRLDRPFQGITDEAMEILKRYHWPGNIRELRNLVESMVVLAPGGRIRPADIPDEIRAGRRDLVPVPMARSSSGGSGDGGMRPQLEFVFRTLVELRVDMDELRKEFEVYREGTRTLERSGGEIGLLPPPPRRSPAPLERDEIETVDVMEVDAGEGNGADEVPGPGVVVYRPGMTMEDLEREAIAAALRQVSGNRRRAAELLGIGERTLYRKIKKFGLED